MSYTPVDTLLTVLTEFFKPDFLLRQKKYTLIANGLYFIKNQV